MCGYWGSSAGRWQFVLPAGSVGTWESLNRGRRALLASKSVKPWKSRMAWTRMQAGRNYVFYVLCEGCTDKLFALCFKGSCRYQALRFVWFIFCACFLYILGCSLLAATLPSSLSRLIVLGSFTEFIISSNVKFVLKLSKCSFFISQARFFFPTVRYTYSHKHMKPKSLVGNRVWQMRCHYVTMLIGVRFSMLSTCGSCWT